MSGQLAKFKRKKGATVIRLLSNNLDYAWKPMQFREKGWAPNISQNYRRRHTH